MVDTLQGQCFDTVGIVGCKFRTIEGLIDYVTRQVGFFFKFSLLHYLSYLLNVLNNGIWKMYKKITNDLEPGLNLLEKGD